MTRSIHVAIDGTADFREWLAGELDQRLRGATVTIVASEKFEVRCRGFARHYIDRSGRDQHESDDGDYDAAEWAHDVIDVAACEYPGSDDGLDRWGEAKE